MAASTGSSAFSYLNQPGLESAFNQPMVDPVAWMKAFRIKKSPDSDYGSYLRPVSEEFLRAQQRPEATPDAQAPYQTPVSEADYLQRAEADLALNRAYNRDMLQDYYSLTRRQNLESMYDAFPLQALAADIATRRNLAASKGIAYFKDVNLPTAQAVRNLYAQQQKEGASTGMAREQAAITDAYRAAVQGSGIGYRGQTFNVG